MASQRIDAATRAPDVSQQQLYDRSRSYDLSARGMLCPSNCVNDCAGLLHVTILTNGCEHIRSLNKLIFRDARDAFYHLGRVARVLSLEQLKHAALMLE